MQGRSSPEDVKTINKMNDILRHRGPDGAGTFVDDKCVLGHRRLAIIDLSDNGKQPFASDDGRFQLVYNGEIYNYLELREELRILGWKFRTQTDTEVLLKAYQQYGKACLPTLNGMFAFVIYDQKDQTLFAARDRVGIKPLYYVKQKDKIYFASEIKAFRAVPGLSFCAYRQAIFASLVFIRTDIHEETFFQEVKRLPKGHYAELRAERMDIRKWWDAQDYVANRSYSLKAVCARLEDILTAAVTYTMRSDVPVGSCLSGGLDSSILLGILLKKKLVADNYQTFTVSFPRYKWDEYKYVKDLMAKHSFINHTTTPTNEQMYETFEEYCKVHDEPTLNAAYYAQYELMRLAKEKGVTVLIDGQGGDENFAG